MGQKLRISHHEFLQPSMIPHTFALLQILLSYVGLVVFSRAKGLLYLCNRGKLCTSLHVVELGQTDFILEMDCERSERITKMELTAGCVALIEGNEHELFQKEQF